ncbi:MAG: TonB-dependent receptor [Bacteroidetes bacterium]|nr:TonB-dependent receptor [Bacteroidota bacterium]
MMRYSSFSLCALTALSGLSIGHAQESSVKELQMDSVLKTVQLLPASVTAAQFPDRAPFATQQITSEMLEQRDGSLDLPFLLRYTPSLVVTSDAGAGIGYTSLRIRGSDQSHINVTINGIPLNDAESHQVYWVDLPDLSSSVDGLQVQRGVGSSSNGPGAFGATIALNTLSFDREPQGKMVLSAGSFGSARSMVKWSSGRVGDGFYIEGRASRVVSNGFVDRATSDLSSMQLGLGYLWDSGHLTYTAMLGHERTYQAWYGVPQIAINGTEAEILDWANSSYEYGYGTDTERIEDLIDRRERHNYYRYQDEVDDYRQDHHQLHLAQELGAWDLGLTAHYTAGSGFYEQFKPGADLALYGVADLVIGDSTIESGDVIRRRWLDNDFQGVVLNAQRSWERLSMQWGGGAFDYEGAHFGTPLWMQHASNTTYGSRYYDNIGKKTDRYGFAGFVSDWAEGRVRSQVELQARQVAYSIVGTDNDQTKLAVDDRLFFLNPKVGIDWLMSPESRFFGSIAQGNREPVRTDYIDRVAGSQPLPESMTDWELGWEHDGANWSLQAVAFYMDYRNQLVLTGALNDTGSPIQQNVDRSHRAGVEWMSAWHPKDGLSWQGTATGSVNRIESFSETLYDYAEGFEPVVAVDHGTTDIGFSPNLTASSVAACRFWDRSTSEGRTTATLEWAARYVGKQYLDNTSNDRRSLEAYAVNDLRLQWSWERPTGTRLTLNAFLRNALNTAYSANGWTYSYLYGGVDAVTTENYVYPQAGRNGMFSVEVSF